MGEWLFLALVAMQSRSSALPVFLALVAILALLSAGSQSFVAPRAGSSQQASPSQTAVVAGTAAMLAAAPLPAYAGGMFDFGLTLPFVAVTFLLMMVVLNALWYSPVTNEMEERNAKLLQTLSEATDMLTKADELQVEYTEEIRQAREKASKAVADYRKTTQASIDLKLAAAAAQRDTKAAEVKSKLNKDMQARIDAAEDAIAAKKAEFVDGILAKV